MYHSQDNERIILRGTRTRTKLIIRTIILMLTVVATIIDVNLVSKFMTLNIIGSIKLYQLLWIYLMYEMVIVLIPNFNNYSYSGKHLKRHYNEVKEYSNDKLIKYTKENIKYPERFSPISNKSLRCSECDNNCRYNKSKANKNKQTMNDNEIDITKIG